MHIRRNDNWVFVGGKVILRVCQCEVCQSGSKSTGALSNKESPESAAEQFSPQATG